MTTHRPGLEPHPGGRNWDKETADPMPALPSSPLLELRLALVLVVRRTVELVQLGNDPAPAGMTTRDRMKRARQQVARQNEITAELARLADRLETL